MQPPAHVFRVAVTDVVQLSRSCGFSKYGQLLARAAATILSEFSAATQHVSVDASVEEANRLVPRL